MRPDYSGADATVNWGNGARDGRAMRRPRH